MNTDILVAVGETAVVLLGIWLSNIVYDRGVPHYVSRKIGHGAGGVAFLSTILLSSAWWPMAVSLGFSLFFITARRVNPDVIRGVGGSGRSRQVMAEVWFPVVAIPVFGISWLWLDWPWVAITCLLYMAWGDGVTGLVRSVIYKHATKGLWGSLAMLCICLAISAAFIRPFWIGAVASVAAVITEWAFGDCGYFKFADDNLAIPLVSMAVIIVLMAITGIL